MVKVLLFIVAFAVMCFAQSLVWVDGYYRSDGTYVAGHYRSVPNNSTYDNYGSYYNGNSSSSSSSSSDNSTYNSSSSSSSSSGSTWVDGYYRSDGTYVRGYYRRR